MQLRRTKNCFMPNFFRFAQGRLLFYNAKVNFYKSASGTPYYFLQNDLCNSKYEKLKFVELCYHKKYQFLNNNTQNKSITDRNIQVR